MGDTKLSKFNFILNRSIKFKKMNILETRQTHMIKIKRKKKKDKSQISRINFS